MNQKFNDLTKQFSKTALQLAHLLWQGTTHGKTGDSCMTYEEAAARLGVSAGDAYDAAYELQLSDLVTQHDSGNWCYAKGKLFVMFDEHWKPCNQPWNPADDAITLARALVDADLSGFPEVISQTLGWSPRRLNPALNFLTGNGYAEGRKFLNSGDFETAVISTSETRRFLRSHGYKV